MIIEIDGYERQVLIMGKTCTKQQLKQKYLKVKESTQHVQDLPEVFCRIFQFELLPYDQEIEVDFVIDTDTDRIYAPTY